MVIQSMANHARLIQTQIEGAVATLTLNRPKRHNSLIPAMLEEMLDALDDFAGNPDVRVILLTANGRSFSTGGDVRAFYENLDNLAAYAANIVGLLNQVILKMIATPQPILAAVHDIVTGGSMGFILASDIVLVAPQASFTPYYSVVGFSPDGGWTAMLPHIIGHRRTAESLFTNRTITAVEAVNWGLANQLISGERLIEKTIKIANQIASLKSGANRVAKRTIWQTIPDLPARLEDERQRFVSQIVTREAIQGMRAFLGIAEG